MKFKSRGRSYEGDKTLGEYDSGSNLISGAPPTLAEQYEGFKTAATLLGPTRFLTTMVDGLLTVNEFLTGNTANGALGVGSYATSLGVELMAKPNGHEAAGVISHIVGIAYDKVNSKE